MSSVTRQRNPRGEGARLREPLIDATVELISELGDAGRVSVRAITKRAGVSPTALYLHFPDRDAVVDAAVDAGFAAFNGAVLGAATDPHPRERLRAMGAAYLDFADRQPHLYGVIFSVERDHESSGDVDRTAGFEGLIDVVTELGGPDDVLDKSVALWTALHGYATLRRHTMKEFPPPDAFLERLLDAYF